jgi:hypothetical protein
VVELLSRFRAYVLVFYEYRKWPPAVRIVSEQLRAQTLIPHSLISILPCAPGVANSNLSDLAFHNKLCVGLIAH